jgi:isopentenyl-diphosphate delta-isomerase
MSTELDTERIWVVDRDNRALAVMNAQQAHLQGLRHRGFLLLVSDPRGRLVLRRLDKEHPLHPGRWDIAGSGHVRAGEAAEEAALRHLPPGTADPQTLRYMLTLEEGAGTGEEIVDVFAASVSDQAAQFLARDPKYLVVDLDELAALAVSFPEQLTPALTTVWAARLYAVAAS